MLFQLVEGRDLDGLLLELVERVPWDTLAAALEGDRQWFTFSTTPSQMATSSVEQMTTSPALQAPPPPPQALEEAQSNMDLSPDFEDSVQPPSQVIIETVPTHSPQTDGEEPMDTREDRNTGEKDLDGDQVGDGGVDEQENDVDEMVSRLDNAVQPSRASPRMGVKRTSTLPPKNTPNTRHRRPGGKHNPELLGKGALKRLLTAGESHSMPIDVEAVDLLMRNFPITQEHQVHFAGADILNPYLIISERTGFHKSNFLIRRRQTSKRIVFLPEYCIYTMNFY